MEFPDDSLRAFLANAKSSLHNAITDDSCINLVIGNQSADLDSFSSSIIFAYFCSKPPGRSNFSSIYVPVLNIPSSDVHIRPELLALLPHAKLEPNQLITLDDLPSPEHYLSKLKPERTRWYLVDHNALQGPLRDAYGHRVCGCIDHHSKEDDDSKKATSEPYIIRNSGSCTSLVVNYFRPSRWKVSQGPLKLERINHQNNNSEEIFEARRCIWGAEIAKLALASVLIDTYDLTAVDKITEEDQKAVEFLEAKIAAASGPHDDFDRGKFFKEIRKAKESVEDLEISDILRKDYKQWLEGGATRVGISSVMKPLSYLISKCGSKESLLKELKSYAQARDLSVMAVMTKFSSPTGDFTKELLVWPMKICAPTVLEKFNSTAQAELQLDSWTNEDRLFGSEESVKVWRQRNVKKGRKQVAPLLRKAAKI